MNEKQNVVTVPMLWSSKAPTLTSAQASKICGLFVDEDATGQNPLWRALLEIANGRHVVIAADELTTLRAGCVTLRDPEDMRNLYAYHRTVQQLGESNIALHADYEAAHKREWEAQGTINTLRANRDELLAALQAFMELHDQGQLYIEGETADDPVLTQARAAITKATT